MPPTATAHDWLVAALVALGAFALLGVIWYLTGDPDRSDRLRARFESRYYVLFAGVAALQAVHAIDLAAARSHAAAVTLMGALCWALLALQVGRSPLFKPPAP